MCAASMIDAIIRFDDVLCDISVLGLLCSCIRVVYMSWRGKLRLSGSCMLDTLGI